MRRFLALGLALAAFTGCKSELSADEKDGCRTSCRVLLQCDLNQPSTIDTCTATCESSLLDANQACQDAYSAWGQCGRNITCDKRAGLCEAEIAALSACDGMVTVAVNQVPASDAGASNFDAGQIDAGNHRSDVGLVDAGFADPNTFIEGIFDFDGLRTYVKIMGAMTSTVPPVVFVHEGPAISHEYQLPLVKTLMPGRTLVFYDMRASGLTSFGDGTASSTITAAQHADDIDELVRFLEARLGTPKVDLLGHGYGAGIAALYAADYPNRVSRLILTSPFASRNAHLVTAIGESNRRLTSPDRQREMRIRNRPECLQNFSMCYLEIWAIYGPRSLCEQNYDKFFDMTFEHGTIRSLFFVQNQLRESQYDWRPTLSRITTPTTVISGLCSPTPHVSDVEYVNSIAGAVHHVLPDAGDFPLVETSTTYFGLVNSALIYP